jgi:hypothetical protein
LCRTGPGDRGGRPASAGTPSRASASRSRPSRRVFERARPMSDPRRDRLRSRLTCARASAEGWTFSSETFWPTRPGKRDVPSGSLTGASRWMRGKIFLLPSKSDLLKKPRGRARDALPRATPRTGTTRVKCFATSPLALCARCVLARTPPRCFPRARGRLGFLPSDEAAIVSYAPQSGRVPLVPLPPAGSADPNAPAPVPRPRRRAPCTRPPARSPRTRPRFPWTTPRRRGPR